jgi:hypothetical protein
VHFNLATGVVTLQSGVATGTISDAGNGWWRCTVTQTLTAQSPYCYVAASNALNTVSYLGDGVSGVYIDGGQVEAGAVASAYLRVDTAANDYDASGFPVGLDFDIDDTMQTGTVDFTATNKVTAFAGTRKTSDAQGSIIVELGPNSQSTAGSFALFGTGSPGVGDQAWRSSGTAFALCAPAGSPAPISCVYTGQADIAADVCVLRKNGAQINTVATDQGTGNYSSNPLYIGARSGGTAGFVGRIYSLIVRGAATSAADVAAAERYVNAKTGAY